MMNLITRSRGYGSGHCVSWTLLLAVGICLNFLVMPASAQKADLQIVVTPAVITFETVGAGESLPAEAFHGDDTRRWIDEVVSVMHQNALPSADDALPSAWLVRTNTPADEARDVIQPLCRRRDARFVLSHHLRVKVGLKRGWKHEGVPLVYDIWKPMVNQSTARYRAVLRRCQSGEEEWRGEFQIRGIPLRGSEHLSDELRKTHETFPKEESP